MEQGDAGDDALKMLLQADVSTRVLFLGTLFATKSTAWAAGVLLAAATRPRYAPLLYRGPGARILQSFRSTFPAATVRIDALSARAAASRSAKFLARATGMNPADLAPAAAEARERILYSNSRSVGDCSCHELHGRRQWPFDSFGRSGCCLSC